ncbi:MAG TPA: hypothetical protein VGJ51_13150 [Candidatus Angelobacter sp.]
MNFPAHRPNIIELVRRLVCCVALLSFALSLHASVPANRTSRAAYPSGGQAVQPVFDHGRPALVLTAAPADVSFYEEFYPAATVRHEQPPKTSVLHWFGSLIKKAVRR